MAKSWMVRLALFLCPHQLQPYQAMAERLKRTEADLRACQQQRDRLLEHIAHREYEVPVFTITTYHHEQSPRIH